jgi:hypothetical protein
VSVNKKIAIGSKEPGELEVHAKQILLKMKLNVGFFSLYIWYLMAAITKCYTKYSKKIHGG